MPSWHETLIRKLQAHSDLGRTELAAIRGLAGTTRAAAAGDDIVKQGEAPNTSVVVLRGMLARYHTVRSGRRQYLSLHIVGDMPDAQALFLQSMDHAVCAMDAAEVVLVPHRVLLALFKAHPTVGFAVWRETLTDAAIFREAITNNGARPLNMRLAHFLCEQFYRARAIGLAEAGACSLPLTQTQVGETIGASLPSVSRALHWLRRTRAADLRDGRLIVHDWDRMRALGDFNPGHLHLRKDIAP